jgi:hypothetical protein
MNWKENKIKKKKMSGSRTNNLNVVEKQFVFFVSVHTEVE